MFVKGYVVFVWLSTAASLVGSSHFRGAHFWWRATGIDNQVSEMESQHKKLHKAERVKWTEHTFRTSHASAKLGLAEWNWRKWSILLATVSPAPLQGCFLTGI